MSPETVAALEASLPICSPGSTYPPQGYTWSRKGYGARAGNTGAEAEWAYRDGAAEYSGGPKQDTGTSREKVGWESSCYHREDRSTSGARYQRVATYSVRA